jgi:hypothetical protein
MEEEEEEEPDENFDKEFSQNIIFVEQNQQRVIVKTQRIACVNPEKSYYTGKYNWDLAV